MQTLLKYILGLAILSLVSCKKEQITPKVKYEDSKSKIETTVKVDSSSIKIADLPILMEGTKYLIHPIGDVRVYDDYKSVYGSSKTNQVSYAISNYNRFELTGYFTNLKFQNIDSTEVRTLTTDRIQIQTVTFLNTFAEKTKKQILVYSFVDNDTNKDGNVNQNDIKSLAISSIDGSNFKKLSEDLSEVMDWNIIEAQNRLYFRCIEDINKNGAFDKNDKVHYHYINLLDKDWKVEEYMPI
ncbi:hypothetical protein [uncultured Flavobacterium sp.]|uniref:hypothetical protein n=1 Tax=uncultured Flavobacterium sp. TaxID=165435 RepID=UPI0030EBEBD8|tara:strand:+ start:52805 stop:53527 length:723 start_codon:yes stop_codon:yes gene_type:complete